MLLSLVIIIASLIALYFGIKNHKRLIVISASLMLAMVLTLLIYFYNNPY